jgi:hypothetical protein
LVTDKDETEDSSTLDSSESNKEGEPSASDSSESIKGGKPFLHREPPELSLDENSTPMLEHPQTIVAIG